MLRKITNSAIDSIKKFFHPQPREDFLDVTELTEVDDEDSLADSDFWKQVSLSTEYVATRTAFFQCPFCKSFDFDRLDYNVFRCCNCNANISIRLGD